MNLARRNVLFVTVILALCAAPPVPLIGVAQAQSKVDSAKLLEPHPLEDRWLGSADANVVIVEYASTTCPHCAKFHTESFPVIKREYIDTGKVRFIFREFPLNDVDLAAVMLARCAVRFHHVHNLTHLHV